MKCGRNASIEKLRVIARIIREEGFDIVALQEVFSEYPKEQLMRELGMNWKGHYEQSRETMEGYAFLWNTRRMELAKTRLSDGSERIYYPRIYNQYRLKRDYGQVSLIRNPFLGRFVPKSQPYLEFRIINTHIRFSGDSSITSNDTDSVSLSDVEMRRNEFDVLAGTIYPKEAEKVYGIGEAGKLRAAYTILIGDYNLNLRREWTKGPYLEEIFEISDNGKCKTIRTFQESLSTIKRITDEEDFKNHEKYANNYDHASYDTRRFEGLKVNTKTVDAVRRYNNSDFLHYRKTVSDHIPICLEFDNS